jgi:HlyD family secretion protein
MSKLLKRFLALLAAAAMVGLAVWAVRPKPLTVETARAVRGPLQVTIDEDGQTRAHDRYTLAAPIAGRLSRITVHEGDSVGPKMVIATISPLPIDARELAQTRAQIDSLQALKKEAEQHVERATAEHEQALREVARYQALYNTDDVSRQVLEQAQTAEKRATKELAAARYKVQSTDAEVSKARAGLISVEAQQKGVERVAVIRPPTEGRVLRVLEPSERVVAAGTPLVTLSNPNRIEVVVDLLSTDAVNVKPNAVVFIEGWGGPKPLRGLVRIVEPYGFTKVSALGIEEQRVNVIVDFVDSPASLGDGYRVEARIVAWESADVLKIPTSALFRTGQEWSVFITENGIAKLQIVELNHRNATEAEITRGLAPGQEVILHPSTELKEGVRVVSR